MADIARIGFSADTGDLASAKQSLEALVPSAKKVERAAEGVTSKLRQAAAGGAAAGSGLSKAASGIGSGFDVLTGKVNKNFAAINKSINSWQSADKSAQVAGSSVLALGGGFDVLTGKVNKNFAAINNTISGWNTASAAARQADAHVQAYRNSLASTSAASQQASGATNNVVASIIRVGNASTMADAHVQAYRNSLSTVAPAATSAKSSLDRLGAAANDNINRLQATPGNIAAQFQDIGVSAAGGMQPFLIALQQGTQLSAAFQGGLGGVAAALKQVFGPTAILTILFVGLVAAGLQMVNWMELGQTLLYGLADGMDMLAGFVEEASVALLYFSVVAAIAFGPRILASVLTLASSIGATLYGMIGRATVAMIVFASANPFGFIVIAIGLVIVAMIALNDAFGGVFTGILRVVKNVANAILRFFAGAFNGILKVAENTVNRIIGAFEGIAGFLGFDVSVGRVDLSGASIDLSDPNRDLVGDIGSGISSLVSSAASGVRGLADGFLNSGTGDASAGRSGGAASGRQSEAQRRAEAYAEIVKGSKAATAALVTEANALGMSESAARLYRNEQALLAQATERGVQLTAEQREEFTTLAKAMTTAQVAVEIREMTNAFKEQLQALQDDAALIGLYGVELEYAQIRQDLFNDAVKRGIIDQDNMTDAMRAYVATLGDQAFALAQLSERNVAADFIEDFTRSLTEQTFALEREAGELYLTGAALEAYRMETDLLVAAKRAQITLDPEVLAGLKQQQIEYANLSDTIARQREQVEFNRDTFKGFFNDMLEGLRNGQSAWQVFGNAVLSVVDKIIDRLLNMEGGGLDKLLNLGMSLFGVVSGSEVSRLSGSAGATIDANPSLFAKGGAFTNGVYNSPTMFEFAKGGSFGVMGEAGPEAVMPLKRGSDGSLGVQVQASQPQEIVVRVVADDGRFNAYVDDRIGQNAPAIAEAGAAISNSEQSFMATRRIARR